MGSDEKYSFGDKTERYILVQTPPHPQGEVWRPHHHAFLSLELEL